MKNLPQAWNSQHGIFNFLLFMFWSSQIDLPSAQHLRRFQHEKWKVFIRVENSQWLITGQKNIIISYLLPIWFIIQINLSFQIFVMICLFLARYGADNGYRIFGNGSTDMTFLGIGLIVGYAIIVPAIILTYLIGANMTFLVIWIFCFLSISFLTVWQGQSKYSSSCKLD